MSNPIDALIPPRQADYALASFPEPAEEESDGLENYTFDTAHSAWVCNTCEVFVANPYGHTSWHARLDKIDTA